MSIGDKNAVISKMHAAINKLEVICWSTQIKFAITQLFCMLGFFYLKKKRLTEIVWQQTEWHRMHCLGSEQWRIALYGSFGEKGVHATSLNLALFNINNKASFLSCNVGMWEQDNKISPAYQFSLEFGQSLRPKANQSAKTQVCWWLVQTTLALREFQHDILAILITERDWFS